MGEKIKMGSTVKDSVTGFIGVLTARCEYLHGAPAVLIEAMIEGKPTILWVTESRAKEAGGAKR